MRYRIALAVLCLAASSASLNAQEFTFLNRTVQVHGFASEGLVYTDTNNWLTMHSNRVGYDFADFGVNASSALNDKLRIGAQLYDRDLGELGRWHPALDWAVVDYKFRPWLGVRAGKVKTVLGLYNDTQDLEFLHTFALLPQSVYPIDLRDAAIAHVGGDIYGKLPPVHRFALAYTAYAGHRSDSIYSGYPYLLTHFPTLLKSLGGAQYGADVRLETALPGLLVGISRLNASSTGKGTSIDPLNPSAGFGPYTEHTRAEWTNQFYGQYTRNRLQLASEYRRYYRDSLIFSGTSESLLDVRGWYVSGSYHLTKRFYVGSYYSHYVVHSFLKGALAFIDSDPDDARLPANHVYDKVVTARVDLTRWWNVKVEGHFMNGYGNAPYPDGFYPQLNPNGFKPNTNALVARTGFYF